MCENCLFFFYIDSILFINKMCEREVLDSSKCLHISENSSHQMFPAARMEIWKALKKNVSTKLDSLPFLCFYSFNPSGEGRGSSSWIRLCSQVLWGNEIFFALTVQYIQHLKRAPHPHSPHCYSDSGNFKMTVNIPNAVHEWGVDVKKGTNNKPRSCMRSNVGMSNLRQKS